VCAEIKRRGWALRATSRTGDNGTIAVGGISGQTDWLGALVGCDAVVHLAARVHMMGRAEAADTNAFSTINRDATIKLAEDAARSGVQRLVFMSTIKVNGEGRTTPYRADERPAPEGAYAISKWEAEQGLAKLAARTGLEIVIIRPPLVYGPGVRGNLRSLIGLVRRGLPLPLGSVRNSRSLIGVTNLASAVCAAVEHPAAGGQTYLVSDQNDLSVPDLIRAIARAAGVPARLVPFPPVLLQVASAMIGRQQSFQQLVGSLTVDANAITRELGWRPMRSLHEELASTMSALSES
jgi:nucleoside-diphosphate-sugar epimerase